MMQAPELKHTSQDEVTLNSEEALAIIELRLSEGIS